MDILVNKIFEKIFILTKNKKSWNQVNLIIDQQLFRPRRLVVPSLKRESKYTSNTVWAKMGKKTKKKQDVEPVKESLRLFVCELK